MTRPGCRCERNAEGLAAGGRVDRISAAAAVKVEGAAVHCAALRCAALHSARPVMLVALTLTRRLQLGPRAVCCLSLCVAANLCFRLSRHND